MSFVLKSIIFKVFTKDVATGLKSITVQPADGFNLGGRQNRGNRTAVANDLGNLQEEILSRQIRCKSLCLKKENSTKNYDS